MTEQRSVRGLIPPGAPQPLPSTPDLALPNASDELRNAQRQEKSSRRSRGASAKRQTPPLAASAVALGVGTGLALAGLVAWRRARRTERQLHQAESPPPPRTIPLLPPVSGSGASPGAASRRVAFCFAKLEGGPGDYDLLLASMQPNHPVALTERLVSRRLSPCGHLSPPLPATAARAVAAGACEAVVLVDSLGAAVGEAALHGLHALFSPAWLASEVHLVKTYGRGGDEAALPNESETESTPTPPNILECSLGVIAHSPQMLQLTAASLAAHPPAPKPESLGSYLVAADLFAEAGAPMQAALSTVLRSVHRWAGRDHASRLDWASWLQHRVDGLEKGVEGSSNGGLLNGGDASEANAPRTKSLRVLEALRDAARVTLGSSDDSSPATRTWGRRMAQQTASVSSGALRENYVHVLPIPAPSTLCPASSEALLQGLTAFAHFSGAATALVPFPGPHGRPLSVALVGLDGRQPELARAAQGLGDLLRAEAAKLDWDAALAEVGGSATAVEEPPPRSSWAGSLLSPVVSLRQALGGAMDRRRRSGGKGDDDMIGSTASKPPATSLPSSTGAAQSPSELLRLRGNEAVSQQDYAAALECYGAALALTPRDPVLLSNRAFVHLRLGRYTDALGDGDSSLALRPGDVKTLLRRGSARRALGDAQGASADFAQALAREPRNRQAARELDAVRCMLQGI